MSRIAELYGLPTFAQANWPKVANEQQCPFLGRKCQKNRKSDPKLTIGTCTMTYGREESPVMICPFRFLERTQVFIDCILLMGLHEPGNELRIISELRLPGGSVDYCLVSTRDGKPRDFVGIEFQTLDTTGTVWPARQRFLREHGATVKRADVKSDKSFGMNWKMTAKTTLVQLHHKVVTFEHLGKHLVLVMQDFLLNYVRREFDFGHIRGQRNGDPMQFHSYELRKEADGFHLGLSERLSTDSNGVARCLGLQASARIELESILSQIEAKLPQSVLLTVAGAVGDVPIPPATVEKADED